MEQISTSSTEIGYYSKDWAQTKIDTTEDLVRIIKTRAYSNAIFENGRRSITNITGFHNYLILDIDNDDTDLSIDECRDKFIQNDIASVIIPSKSHRRDKNGSIKDRFRVVCYFDNAIPTDITKEVYKIMMGFIVKDLHMASFVDTKALNDKSRYYSPSKNLDESLIRETTGEQIKLDFYLKKSTLHNNKTGLIAKIALMRKKSKVAAKKRKLGSKSTKVYTNTKNSTSCSNKQALLPVSSSNEFFIHSGIYKYDIIDITHNIDFLEVIDDCEKIIFEEQSANGVKIKTGENNSYYFFNATNVLFNFKREEAYNFYTYILKNNNEYTGKEVLQYMNQYTNIDSFKSVSEDWQNAVFKSLDISINYKELQANLISLMDLKKITINKNEEDIIIIAGKKVHISEFELQEFQNKGDVINKFQENRKPKK